MNMPAKVCLGAGAFLVILRFQRSRQYISASYIMPLPLLGHQYGPEAGDGL